ncbi:S-layer homology domain-containing protein [Sphaerospermopsis aphanizomenoides BCCUSP55]|uniref:S-layer homology domain-containing protein n=1 Tax=Sphaerospermopsis aphanizomenoides TaxID=459663 RepID=UPI001906D82D|nr:S-layer homology domain-containing protein [Sphaerospermopsis aphanizomenoides]MBK1989379.1 S-layer homology domain-containing protein [Sphaerospermopsis aphanizomenoides BCCUSP55]
MFKDIQTHWAKSSILTAAERNIFKGYPDGTFRPDAPVTRAEFAAIIFTALPKQPSSRPEITFTDVPANHWAVKAIASAYQTNYLSGYPNRIFKPNQPIPRVQALTALVSGLGYGVTADAIATLKKHYTDFGQIPSYAMNAIAAATEKRIIVNYPDSRRLQPNTNATRGEIAAFICRVLEIPTVPFKYIPGIELFVIPPQFDAADPFTEELVRVQKDNKWGYIDKSGKFVIPPKFDDANSFAEGWALVRELKN